MEQDRRNESYLALLEASLEKKCIILNSLYEASKEQDALFCRESLDEKQFDQLIEKKDKLINNIMELDAGFEQIYQHVKDELTIHSDQYMGEITRLKELIKNVTDKGVQLQAIEQRNKVKIENYFRSKRKDIKDFKVSNKSAANYYKSMTDQHQQQSYFFDKKK